MLIILLQADTTLSFSCSNLKGRISKSITVNVDKPLAPTFSVNAQPSMVEFLGGTTISWTSTRATECLINGNWAPLNGNFIIDRLINDTTLDFSFSGLGGISKKSLKVVVGEKPLYIKYIDILCSGCWSLAEERVKGLFVGPDEWRITNFPPTDSSRIIFSKNSKYSLLNCTNLYGKTYSTTALYSLSNDGKKIHLGTFDFDIIKISNDSLIIYYPDMLFVWAGSTSGSGHFPIIEKYKHRFDCY